MNDGFLEVSATDPCEGRHASIDLFFRDLADVHRERAFCLVLSGTGSDGATGLSRTKAHERECRAFPASCWRRMSRNLLTLTLPDLRLEIRTTLFQVQQSGLPVKSREVPLKR